MPTINLNGLNIYYYEENAGSNLKVLFCHGSGGSHAHWRKQNGLHESIHLIAPDLPGHGQSAGEPMNTVAGYRDFIKLFAKGLNLPVFYLAGHSLGGAIALDYARAYPFDLRGIILIASGARLRVAPAILDAFRDGNVWPEMIDFAYGDSAEPSLLKDAQKEWHKTPPAVFYADFTACDHFDLSDKISAIGVPALIIAGEQDRLTPPKYSLFLQHHLPLAQLKLLENAGHMVMLEKSDAVNKLIIDFVKQGFLQNQKSP